MNEGLPIAGGYILLARRLLNSELMSKPPHYAKLWLWILLKTFWRDGEALGRGQLHTTIAEMQKIGGYIAGNRKCLLTVDEVRSAYGFLVKTGAITTVKATRGMVITVCNYDFYQLPEHYGINADMQESGTISNPTPNPTPNPTGENGISNEIVKGKGADVTARTPPRTPPRKPPEPRTIDEEGKRSKNIVASAKKQPTDHHLFSDWFCYAFEIVEGDCYIFEGAKDGSLVAGMLKNVPWKELVAKACHYFVHNDRFPKGRPTIAGLNSSINKYQGHMDGKTEMFRAKGLIPPEGVQLEEWRPREA